MLTIKNSSGRTLLLSPDAVIPVERNNPLFTNPDEFLQDVSYPVTIPRSPNSEIFFSGGHRVESSNATYLIKDVTFFASGTRMLKGNIRYTKEDDRFLANLEPNFAAINSLIKNIRLTEIRTEDAEFGFTRNAFEARMLDSCRFPEKYPYVFFPLYNPDWDPRPAGPTLPFQFVNLFDYFTQRFVSENVVPTANCPFWKLTYILKQIATYLGFTASGGVFTDKEFAKKCVYTRLAGFHRQIQYSMAYMPNILISDFLKYIRERYHLSIDFDLLTGELRVESFKTIKDAPAVDLSKYISKDGKFEAPAEQGFTVVLKTDEADQAYAVTGIDDAVTYPADFSLVCNDGKNKIELNCATTKGIQEAGPAVFYATTRQSFVVDFDENLPEGIEYTDINDPTTLNNWPLRIINYEGYLPFDGGNFYPCSSPDNLNSDDVDFYRFLNDSKRIRPVFYIPAAKLATLRVTDKLSHRTSAGNYVTYIVEQLAYDAGRDVDLIPVKVTARTLSFSDTTKVSVVPRPADPSEDNPDYLKMGLLKAYFDTELHGIKSLEVQFVGDAGNNYLAGPINFPTNVKGTGGAAVPIYTLTTPASHAAVELRIFQGKPAYLLHRGIRTNFTQVGNYYKVTVDLWAELELMPDFYTIFF